MREVARNGRPLAASCDGCGGAQPAVLAVVARGGVTSSTRRRPRLRRRHARDFSLTETTLWEDLLELFDLIDEGHRRYEVPAYNGGFFDDEQHAFLREKRLPDWYLARVIDQLSRATETQQEDEDEVGLYAVDYRDLRIQHLGSIYENLLELHPEVAREPTVNDFTGDEIPAGHVFLRTERGERRSTGSYYTPDQITDYLVAETLSPLCREMNERLRDEITSVEERIQHTTNDDEIVLLKETHSRLIGDFDDRVLRLRVLDPAMGSGHFLLSACNLLAEESTPFCNCLNADLPLDVNFQKYITVTITVGTPAQYDRLSADDKRITPRIVSSRDRCVAEVFASSSQ